MQIQLGPRPRDIARLWDANKALFLAAFLWIRAHVFEIATSYIALWMIFGVLWIWVQTNP